MARGRALKPINISNVPELLRIAEEVRSSNTPRLLKRDNEDLAVLVPAARYARRLVPRRRRKPNYEAFKSAAGGWKDVDTDKLVADIYADRRTSDRLPVEL
ncbi:MAG: hypothetical protein HY675_07245 [Chloroflexi bacterium]|nr:hypothetical protein [Chloroflexota bacterium]